MICSLAGRNDCLIEFIGTVYLALPTTIDIHSIIAKVRGIFSVVMLPCPGTLSTSTVPPMVLILDRTTSIPTPRPENSVTFSLVENPGWKMKEYISLSVSSSSGFVNSLFARALLRIFSRSRPAPSSAILITTSPLAFSAERVTVPDSSLPLSTRTSGISMPWSILFRMICISGSPICSIIFLSTSVSSPTSTSFAFLFSFFVISRTIRFIFIKVASKGTMRSSMTLS